MSSRNMQKAYRSGIDETGRIGVLKKIIQPEPVGDEQSDQLLIDTSRKDLADGLPLVNADPFVPPVRRHSIKVVRSACLLLVMLLTHTGLAAAVLLFSVHEHEDHYKDVLRLDVCNNGTISEALHPQQRRLEHSGEHVIYSPEAGPPPPGPDGEKDGVPVLDTGETLAGGHDAAAQSSHKVPAGPVPSSELPASLAWTQALIPSKAADPLAGAPKWVHQLGGGAKKVTFHAVDENGAERLPELVYFSSEDNRGMIKSNLYMALSFGLLRMHPLSMDVTLSSEECLPNYIPGLRSLPPSHDIVDNFAQAALGGLGQSLRREPLESAEGPWSNYGALLLRKDVKADGRAVDPNAEIAWDPRSRDFQATYQPSRGVLAYVVLFALVSVGLTIWTASMLGFKVWRTWKRSAADWIVQYDYLWLLAGKQIEAARAGKRPDIEQPGAAVHGASGSQAPRDVPNADEAVFTDAIQLCSPFFILDNVVGDARACEEQWNLAIISSLAHGLVLATFVVLPAVTGIFIRALKMPFFALAAMNLSTGVSFGVLYYCSASFLKPLRRLMLYACLGTIFVCVLWSLFYLNTAVVFLLTRLVATPAEVIALAVPAATVWTYLAVMTSRYQSMQTHYQEVAESKQTKGKTWAALSDLGLSNSAIVFTVVAEVCLMLLTTALLLVVAALHADNPDMALSNPVPAVVLPVMTVVRSMHDLEAKKQAVDIGTKHLVHRFERDF